MADITLEQILRYETIIGVFNQLKPNGRMVSNFYGLTPTAPAAERAGVGSNRTIGYDLFNSTRTLAQARAPQIGPARVAPKPVGHASATVLRFYESIVLQYEKIFGTRPLGDQYTTVDRNGQSYIGKQISFLAQRQGNAAEFAAAKMLTADGFSVKITPDNYILGNLGASGAIDVNYDIPTANKTQVAQLAGGANVIATSWDNAAAKIVGQLANLNKVSERLTGYPTTEFWINSTTFGHMVNNSQLAAVGGSAYRIFDTMSRMSMETVVNDNRNSGFSVQWRAMPMYNFHVYDGVLNVGDVSDSTAEASSTLIIPDNMCLATPAPDGMWCGMAVGHEPIKEQDTSPVDIKEGLAAWTKDTNDPPGVELRSLNNFVPILPIPSAVFPMTVIF